MSEEEIINKTLNCIYTCNDVIDDEFSDYSEVESAKELEEVLQSLLDLYNKEKEKNLKLREVISNLNNNWVSKHEIKAKIEKLKDKEQELTDEQGYWGGSELQTKIETLEELLEE